MTELLGRASLRDVQRLLWDEWDPIGLRETGGPADEYDSYAGPVWSMLSGGEGAAEIAQYLERVATQLMGLPEHPQLRADCATVATKLASLNVSPSAPPDAPVLARIEHGVGRLTLNRPKALHALTTDMCREMITALLASRDDPAVRAVLLDAAPPRGFCAGGDIRALSSAQDDGGALAREFFRVEYRLNTLLFDYPKPTVALMDGVVMGGGVGISAPCRVRVATERTTFAMPETAIGLFPDVGGGWWLPRLPGRTGLWLALTGARLKAADMLLLGLATDYVESAKLPELVERLLADPAAMEAALSEAGGGPGQPELALRTDLIDSLFAGDSVPAILQALDADGGEWATAQAATLRRMSPQALAVTFRQLQLGAQAASFAEEMAREYDLAGNVVMQPDMAEGVRALLVDKDNAPRWSPASLDALTPERVEALFAPREGDRWTPLPPTARTGADA